MVLEAKAALTPGGKPEVAPIPVAPVVVCVIFVKGVLIQSVGEDDADDTVLLGTTVIIDVIVLPTQPLLPVGVMVYVAVPLVDPVAVNICEIVSPLPFTAPDTPLCATVHV